ncbi:hypothetical protein CIRG_08390 [Coccidioides immitis RMSCC 2394]|uniref:Uncharacterized protein n=1 Tax=Coccidioides immitis RMSCC 2394 TaxID=404692 RepID=A0A0J6YNG4_COCIT|nr:hypothetical protein CIRG_08390 [Coccidioides immitis RMSCC 2394]
MTSLASERVSIHHQGWHYWNLSLARPKRPEVQGRPLLAEEHSAPCSSALSRSALCSTSDEASHDWHSSAALLGGCGWKTREGQSQLATPNFKSLSSSPPVFDSQTEEQATGDLATKRNAYL